MPSAASVSFSMTVSPTSPMELGTLLVYRHGLRFRSPAYATWFAYPHANPVRATRGHGLATTRNCSATNARASGALGSSELKGFVARGGPCTLGRPPEVCLVPPFEFQFAVAPHVAGGPWRSMPNI